MQSRNDVFFGGIAVLVFLCWMICLFMALYSATGGRLGSIATYGQIGDTFGSVNALFTGLALIGLIYTLKLQHDQLAIQQKESSREAREQFLTARLNAQAAALQVVAAQHAVVTKIQGPSARKLDESLMTSLNRHGMIIEILSLEAHQGFEGEAWTPSIEKEAIRQYVVKSLSSTVVSFDNLEDKGDVRAATEVINATFHQFQLAAQVFREKYHDICVQFKIVCDSLFRLKNEPAQAIDWCRLPETRYLKGEPPWV
jgi:hypothetical protein